MAIFRKAVETMQMQCAKIQRGDNLSMNHFSQNLYITYSNQKARDLRNHPNINALDKIITLDALILECFEKKYFEYIIDETLGASILHKIIHDEAIEYFSYLPCDAISLNTLYAFIDKCKRNEKTFDAFAKDEKYHALMMLDEHYQEFKQNNRLVDSADIEIRIANEFSAQDVKGYHAVFVDEFHVGDMGFIKSKQQEKILEKLASFEKIEPIASLPATCHQIGVAHEVFDSIDEVRSAIKVARKLLKAGEQADDIIIVASDIAEYAPLYKLFLPEYGMKGFSSVGTPLNHFYASNDERVKKAAQGFKNQVASLEKVYGRLGLLLDERIKEKIKASIIIPDEKIGIEMTEPNQLLGLNRHYKHIIFIGTDINHFPPSSNDNFLYSYEDDINYFYTNNYFLNSQTQLNELKRLSDNLCIITASHSGKRELSRSILISDTFDSAIDISDMLSIPEMALKAQALSPDDALKEYYESLLSNAFSKYDGMGVEHTQVNHLSASQINKYLSCPLAYLYSNKVRIQAPKTTEEGFDAAEQGSLMHLCFELFGKAIKEAKLTSVDPEVLYDVMHQKSLEAFKDEETLQSMGEMNIHHEIFLSNLQAGLKDERPKGLLAKFVDYYIKHANEFDFFQNSEFEKEFALDHELKPYALTSKEDANYFIKGFIDRFDHLQEHINIIDYKSKKMASSIDKKKQEQVAQLKDVQLALYILYASQQHPHSEYKAHLLSFKGDNPYYHFANLSTIEDLKDTVHFSEEYNEQLRKLIYDTKTNIEAGEFAFNNGDETACGYCDFKFICHESVLRKGHK